MKRLTILFSTLSLIVLALIAALPATTALAGGGDCLLYNASALSTFAEGDHYVLTDGVSRMEVLDNATDAAHALAVAQRYTAHCFVGRGNTRPDHRRYVTEYWGIASGLPVTTFAEDCISFDPTNLSVIQNGADWFVQSGGIVLTQFATQSDAQIMATIIPGNGWAQQCFIGRDNHRADRLTYIVEYWKPAPSRLVKVNPTVLQIATPKP